LMTFNEGVHRLTSSVWDLPITLDPRTCLVPARPG
jgi:hypothetical protein